MQIKIRVKDNSPNCNVLDFFNEKTLPYSLSKIHSKYFKTRITSRKKNCNNNRKIQVWKRGGGRFEVNSSSFARREQTDLVLQ